MGAGKLGQSEAGQAVAVFLVGWGKEEEFEWLMLIC